MGFGAFGKDLRLRGGGFFDKILNVGKKIVSGVGKVVEVAKPFVGTVAGVADMIKPGAGSAINTGFNIVDGITSSLKGSGKGEQGEPKPSNRFAQFKNIRGQDWGKPKGPARNVKVDSILRNPIKRAPIYKPSSASEEETESETE
jgi:hypothetical protein